MQHVVPDEFKRIIEAQRVSDIPYSYPLMIPYFRM